MSVETSRRRVHFTLWMTVFLALALSPVSGWAATSPPPSIMATVPFNLDNGPAVYLWLREAVPAVIADRALRMPGVRVSDPAALLAAFAAGGPGEGLLPGRIDREGARRIGAAVGADVVLWGDMSKRADVLTVDLYLSRVDSGVDLVRMRHQGSTEDLLTTLGQLCLAFARELGVPEEGETDAFLAGPAARDRYALTLWGRGRGLLTGLGGEVDAPKARETLIRALRVDPRLGGGWYTLAASYLAEGGEAEKDGISALYETLRHQPWNPFAHKRLADMALARGRVTEARSHLTELAQLWPEDAETHLALARVLSTLDRKADALVEAEAAANASRTTLPINEASLRLVATLRAATGDLRGMEASYRALLTLRPGDREALYALGGAAWLTGRPAEAVKHFERLQALFPEDPVPPHLIGEIALAKGDIPTAINAFQREASKVASGAEVFRYLARAHQVSGERVLRIRSLEKAAALAPSDPAVWNELALARVDAGDLPGALQALDRGAAVAPRWASLQLNRGIVSLKLGELEAARGALEEAVRLDEDLASAHYHLALVAHGLGELERAAEGLRTAVALDPGLHDALYNLAVVQDELGEVDAACASYRDFLRAAPNDPFASRIAARIEALSR